MDRNISLKSLLLFICCIIYSCNIDFREPDASYEEYSLNDEIQWNGLYQFQSKPNDNKPVTYGDLNLNHKYYIKLQDGVLIDYLMPEINIKNELTGKTSKNQLLGINEIYDNGISFKLKTGNLISDLNGVLKKRNDTIFLRFQYFNNESLNYWYMYKEK